MYLFTRIAVCISISVCLFAPVYGKQETFELKSPDGKLKVSIVIEDKITFTISDQDEPILRNNHLSLSLRHEILGNNPQLVNAKKTKGEDLIKPFVALKFSSVRNAYNGLILKFKHDFSVEFRAFDEGVGYRFITSKKGEIEVTDEQVKQGQFAVQPPLEVLEDNFTIRIHLDDTDQTNGALRVAPGSHAKGVYRADDIDWSTELAVICNVRRGGIMLMKPLLLHASSRTTSNHRRRVIHIEFGRKPLPEGLSWSEFAGISSRQS